MNVTPIKTETQHDSTLPEVTPQKGYLGRSFLHPVNGRLYSFAQVSLGPNGRKVQDLVDEIAAHDVNNFDAIQALLKYSLGLHYETATVEGLLDFINLTDVAEIIEKTLG